MNRTIVILNLLVSSISIARPIDDITRAINEDKLFKLNKTVSIRNSDATEDTIPVAINKDDILSSSDLSKVYNSVENVFGKTRYLKEQQENDGFQTPEIPIESHTDKQSKMVEISDDKLEERIDTTPKVEVESRENLKEESKSIETTSKVSENESATPTSKADRKSADNLENDKLKVKDENRATLKENPKKSKERASPEKESERKSIEISNDESNSAWNLLDDIPATRRMLSHSDNSYINVKANTDSGTNEPIETKKAPISNLKLSNNGNQHGPVQRGPHLLQYIHPPIIRRHHPIAPGLITLRTVPIDFRRILIQEKSNVINDNISHGGIEKSEIPESRVMEDKTSDDQSNAYPYTPPVSEIPKMQVSPTNIVYTKLAQASEHPQFVAPNYEYNRENTKFVPPMAYANLMPIYNIPPGYNLYNNPYNYITGFGSYHQYS